jgi:hypothetical protein
MFMQRVVREARMPIIALTVLPLHGLHQQSVVQMFAYRKMFGAMGLTSILLMELGELMSRVKGIR